MDAVPLGVTDALGWLAVAAFLASWALESRDRLGRAVGALGWGCFGLFWLLLVPRFAFVMRSPIETVLSIAAVPASAYAGYRLYAGHDAPRTLTRAVAAMGLFYLPFETIPLLGQLAVETVARQAYLGITWLGYDVALTEGPADGYRSGLEFVRGGHTYATHIVLACTGLGSMTVFAGLIAAVEAPLSRKLTAAAAAVGIIYVLNIARNVFIAVAFGNQWFQVFVGPIAGLLGYSDPGLVSFFIADRVISQGLSLLALAAIAVLVARIVPELIAVLEEAAYVLTRTEIDLGRALSVDDR
ncbi:MAG: archaeosortase A [Halobacteriales archaeon]